MAGRCAGGRRPAHGLAPARVGGQPGDIHARLEDLKSKLGEGEWGQGQDRVTDADRDLIDLLPTGDGSA
jgi:hypothetical protein